MKGMDEWVIDFLKYAKSGDILIMNHLAAHRNPTITTRLESNGITVLFLPVRCAYVLLPLDNCFFATFQSNRYEECAERLTVEQKEKEAKNVFDFFLGKNLAKMMFQKYGYHLPFSDESESVND